MSEEIVTYDFDAAWAEKEVQAPTIKVLGTVYTLPASIPAKLILIATRLQKTNKETDEVPAKDVLEMLNVSLGKKNVTELMDAGLGMDQLEDIMETIQAIYQGQSKADASGPKVKKAPRR